MKTRFTTLIVITALFAISSIFAGCGGGGGGSVSATSVIPDTAPAKLTGKIAVNTETGSIYALGKDQYGRSYIRTYDVNGVQMSELKIYNAPEDTDIRDISYCGNETYIATNKAIYKISGMTIQSSTDGNWNGLGCNGLTLVAASSVSHGVLQVNLRTGEQKFYPTGNIAPVDVEYDERYGPFIYTVDGKKMNTINGEWQSGFVQSPVVDDFSGRPAVDFTVAPVNVENRKISARVTGTDGKVYIDEVRLSNAWGTQIIDSGTKEAIGVGYNPVNDRLVVVDKSTDGIKFVGIKYDTSNSGKVSRVIP